MVDERVDIVVTDKVSPGPAKKLRDIAKAAVSADKALDKLRASISTIDTTALVRMTTASTKLTTALSRETAAQVRLTKARSRDSAVVNKAAVSTQRLAAEQAKTAGAAKRSAASATRARAALIQEESASTRLSAAKMRETSATNTNTSAKNRNAAASVNLAGKSRRLRGVVQNASFQLQDIAVQMQMGTATSIVLGQQLPQLAGGFGAIGAAIGVVLAVGIPLVSYLLPSLGIGAKSAAEKHDALAEAIQAVVAASALARSPITDLTEKYGGSAAAVRNYVEALVRLRDQQAINALQTSSLAIQEDKYISNTLDVVTALDNARTAYDRNAKAALLTTNIEESAISTVIDAYREYKDALNIEDERREQQEFIAVLDDLGLSGQANLDKITTALGHVGSGYQKLKRHTQAQLDELGLTEAQVRRLQVAIAEFQAAKTFSAGATAAQKLRTMLTDMGVDFDNTLIPALIEFEGVARNAFADGATGANTMAAEVRRVADEARRAMDAMEDLRNSAVTGEIIATINLEYRTDPVGRARALAEARALQEQAPLREGASSLDLTALDAEIRALGDAAAATAELNEERRRLNIADSEVNSNLRSGVKGRAAATKELGTLAQDLINVDLKLRNTPFADEAVLENIRIAEQDRLDVVQRALDARIIAEQDAADRVVAINRQANEEIRALQSAQNQLVTQSAAETFGSLAASAKALSGEQSAAYKALFITAKAFAIATSVLKIQEALAQVMADPTAITPAQKFAGYAIIAAQGAAIISSISSVAALKDGGEVFGPGGPRDDRVPIMASAGEFVVNARDAQRNKALLQAINSGQDVGRRRQAFRNGGEVQPAYRAPVSRSEGARVGNQRQGIPDTRPVINVFTRDPDTRIEVTETQRAAATARAVNRGQRNL